VALEQDHIRPAAHLVDEIRLKIPQAAMDGMRFYYGGPLVDNVQQLQKSLALH